MDVLTRVENKVGSTTISEYEYTMNRIGQRTRRAQSGSAFAAHSTDTFVYNAAGELTGSTNNATAAVDIPMGISCNKNQCRLGIRNVAFSAGLHLRAEIGKLAWRGGHNIQRTEVNGPGSRTFDTPQALADLLSN